MSRDMLRKIPRLLDVPVGKKQWNPKIAELLRLLPAEVEREIKKQQTKKGELK